MSANNSEPQDDKFWIKIGGALLFVVFITWFLSSVGFEFLAVNGAVGGTVAIIGAVINKYKDRKIF